MFEAGRVKGGAEEGVQLVLCLPNIHNAVGPIPALDKQGVVVVYHLSTQPVTVGRSVV
jgi:hypothetical protein